MTPTELRYPYDGPEELIAAVDHALRQVVDPEVALSIVDVGLVCGVRVVGSQLAVQVTMTSAACPVTDVILADIETELDAALPPQLAVQGDKSKLLHSGHWHHAIQWMCSCIQCRPVLSQRPTKFLYSTCGKAQGHQPSADMDMPTVTLNCVHSQPMQKAPASRSKSGSNNRLIVPSCNQAAVSQLALYSSSNSRQVSVATRGATTKLAMACLQALVTLSEAL